MFIHPSRSFILEGCDLDSEWPWHWLLSIEWNKTKWSCPWTCAKNCTQNSADVTSRHMTSFDRLGCQATLAALFYYKCIPQQEVLSYIHIVRFFLIATAFLKWVTCESLCVFLGCYRLDTVNSKSFLGKIFLRKYVEFELTVHFSHKDGEKHLVKKFELSGTSN